MISNNFTWEINVAGIEPNGKVYKIENIKEAIKKGTGFTPGITCNVDPSENTQLYQIYFCVDTSGSKFFECNVFPKGGAPCGSEVEFPYFPDLVEEYNPTFGSFHVQ